MSRPRIVLAGLLAAGLLRFGAVMAARFPAPGFPHARHERLFPVCEGCHAGIISDVPAETFPDASDCVRCHDGQRAERVNWLRPERRASNLRFSHARHRELSGRDGEPTECRACHAADGEPSRMNVDAADAENCIGCHEHRAVTHLAGAVRCSRCHLPLTDATSLPAERIARFPKPDWHLGDEYVSRHGAQAGGTSCAVCHARETCERCHANAPQLPAIATLQGDARVAALEAGRAPTYPLPASHGTDDWTLAHGATAPDGAAVCTNCHTRQSCAACHLRGNATIAALPEPAPGAAIGAVVGSSVHASDVATRHGINAASSRQECMRCHSNEMCTGCHAGADSRPFHVANFVERHATDVFTAGSDCRSCHNTETFCGNCHRRVGVGAQSPMKAAFHNGQPMWVLTHGQAARTGLEACTSCHRQSDCIRCHSATGGWGVNPHGPGFDASRVAARSASSCRWCHLNNPLGRSR